MTLVAGSEGPITQGGQASAGPPRHSRRPRRQSRVRHGAVDVVLMAFPLVVALVLSLVAARRALWLDEAATLRMSQQSMSDLLRTLGEVDAVHGLYYLLMHGWISVVGTDPMLVRLPNALFMGVACAGVVVIGRHLAGRNVAVLAGLAFAILPAVRNYGAEARPYAMTTALGCWAMVWLLKAVSSGLGRYWVLYGAWTVLSGLWFAYALLLIPAHAATLALGRVGRGVWVRFCVAAGFAGLVLLPWLLLVAGQRGQVGWIPRTTVMSVAQLPFVWMGRSQGPVLPPVALGLTVWLTVALGLLLWWRGGRRTSVAHGVISLPHVALPWVAVPAAILVAVSLVVPMYSPRYVLYSAPALALLLGWAIAQLGSRRAAIGVAALLTALVVPSLVAELDTSGKDSWGEKRTVLEKYAQPGDVLMATPYGYMAVIDTSFGDEFPRVQSGGPMLTPISYGEAPESVILERLATSNRVWLIPCGQGTDVAETTRLRNVLEPAFELSAEYPTGHGIVRAYDRRQR